MLRLIDRLRIRGIRESFTRDETLRRLSETLGMIRRQNNRLLQAPIEEFAQVGQRNKKQLSDRKAEFNKLKRRLKEENHKTLAKLKKENQKTLEKLRREMRNLEDELRRVRTYCY